ncbi:hypothetical protein [Candidatus Steffania adelgidicola]|uniref:hypothetical protein n=1 Tax=Candidatus Steffania adelgidicola TaxID=1076626 RepID=UPI001D02ADE1|nr:hypothetical protein [Candidatus Steffania adelgidicola]
MVSQAWCACLCNIQLMFSGEFTLFSGNELKVVSLSVRNVKRRACRIVLIP